MKTLNLKLEEGLMYKSVKEHKKLIEETITTNLIKMIYDLIENDFLYKIVNLYVAEVDKIRVLDFENELNKVIEIKCTITTESIYCIYLKINSVEVYKITYESVPEILTLTNLFLSDDREFSISTSNGVIISNTLEEETILDIINVLGLLTAIVDKNTNKKFSNYVVVDLNEYRIHKELRELEFQNEEGDFIY